MKKLGVTKRMTWQEHLKRCAKTWQAKKKREAAKATAKPVPPKVPRRVRGKQQGLPRDID
jgi:hypothetical protein